MIHTSFRYLSCLVAAVSVAGCAGHVNINYRERVACTLVNLSNSTAATTPGHYWSVFSVDAIDNANQATSSFVFDPKKLYVKYGNVRVNSLVTGKLSQAVIHGTTTVPAGQKSGYRGPVAFEIPANLSQPNPTLDSINMYYDDKDTLMFRTGGAPNFVGVCDTSNLPKLPDDG